jgi:hypothetical protein
MKKNWMMLFLIPACFVGCSSEPLPFDAHYTSKDSVTVTYEGKKYILDRRSSVTKTPFNYSFEPDGDLDLIINGTEYEVDSPYDVDSKKKKNKKTSKKTSTNKKTSKSTKK